MQSSSRASIGRPGGFFVVSAAVALALPAIGFGRSFVVPWSRGQLTPSPLLVAHAVAFFAWVVLLLVQALLVRGRRVDLHRRLGWAGVGLAVLMLGTGLAVALGSTARALAEGGGPAASGFLLRLLLELGLFAAFAGVGIALRRRPEAHRRLMLLATMSLMAAASARVPLLVDWPIAVMLVLVGSLAVFDLADRRRVHAATLWGGAALMSVQLAWQPLSETRTWQATAPWLLGALELLPRGG
ncbi:hypothetical protein OV090_05890 [Nannocystis sp. RBIL2]|uniref:hypothetical protein n=1 Tax=Nannocystis sp. RBIL2 TaxID=2996788 RepID=UPI0022707F7F|nr:hypothetical protein [Nannocystis sp. RBIL2]MCY1064280.1 hypothetical protein [Nannocystis sp. RBIL2]